MSKILEFNSENESLSDKSGKDNAISGKDNIITALDLNEAKKLSFDISLETLKQMHSFCHLNNLIATDFQLVRTSLDIFKAVNSVFLNSMFFLEKDRESSKKDSE